MKRVDVECYAGYRANERPTRLTLTTEFKFIQVPEASLRVAFRYDPESR